MSQQLECHEVPRVGPRGHRYNQFIVFEPGEPHYKLLSVFCRERKLDYNLIVALLREDGTESFPSIVERYSK